MMPSPNQADTAKPGRQVLITGAAGFVGRSLASGFADLGWRVIGLDRAWDAGPGDRRVRRVRADLEGAMPRGLLGVDRGVDLVVHAAWLTTDAGTLGIAPVEHIARNLRPLLAILEFAGRVGPGAFIFLSSSGVFAPDDATGGLTDAHHATGDSPYAAAKRAGEALVVAALDRDTAVHVVRLGYLFGPGEVARSSRSNVSLVAEWIAAARAGQRLAVPSNDPLRDWTFTPDLAPVLERLADGPSAGRPVHVGSPHVVRDSEWAALIAAQFPGTEVVTFPADGRVKPPMVPSDVSAVRDFDWTDPAAGLRALLGREVAT